jgi:hypothetical protein
LNFGHADFRDAKQPIEIEVSLSDFSVDERALYGNYIRLGAAGDARGRPAGRAERRRRGG